MPTNSNTRKSSKSRLSLIRSNVSDDGGAIADWGTIDGSYVVDLIQVVSRLGGAVRFGYTRDGGAYSVGIYLDDDRETFYFKPGDDLGDAITRLTELLRDA